MKRKRKETYILKLFRGHIFEIILSIILYGILLDYIDFLLIYYFVFLTLLGCTLQAYKPCTCPASRLKKEPGVSNRDISGLTDRGILHVWSKVLERHPTICGRWQDRATVSQGQGEVTSYRGDYISLAHWLPGKSAEGHTPRLPFDKNNHQLGQGQVCKSGEEGVGEADAGQAGGIQRAREQLPWVAWPYKRFSIYLSIYHLSIYRKVHKIIKLDKLPKNEHTSKPLPKWRNRTWLVSQKPPSCPFLFLPSSSCLSPTTIP